jgi:uncharacterized Fe-S radical SAM superfamily protein PflX
MKTIAKTAFLSGIRKKDIVQKRKNHTNSKLAKNIPQPHQIEDEDTDSEEEKKVIEAAKKKSKEEEEELEKKVNFRENSCSNCIVTRRGCGEGEIEERN